MIDTSNRYSAHRFLIVDDNPFVRSLIQSMLSRCHAKEIKEASDGADAIEQLTIARGNVDCVLCDWNMGPVNGLELLRAIRAGNVPNTSRSLRFIFLTGYAGESVVKAALELDTNGYLVKPVSMEHLIRAIDAALAKTMLVKATEVYLSKDVLEIPQSEFASDTHQPTSIPPSPAMKPLKKFTFPQFEQVGHESGIHFRHEGKSTRPVVNEQRLGLDQIVAGKVLAESIHTKHGTLLLAAGIVLTDPLLERLRELAITDIQSLPLLVGDYAV